ncbi:MAG: tryptophan--tRNA ligase [Candidatus Sumerlaeia bacterium]|nr:tryptophan--tRNA ligase [Candidatus Sumerlaeia bacterium]
MTDTTTARPVLLSGSRPTGRQHLGNYIGALVQWLDLQDSHSCFFMIADWHALTSTYRDTSELPANIRNQMLDWLAIGLDPERSVIFLQSAVKEHAELSLLLGMFAPLGLMERCTSWKDNVVEQGNELLRTYGFLGYPCLQAADILLYDTHVVPVGKDQVEHIEKAQDLAERVNHYYGGVFRVPQWRLSPQAPVLLGNDGRKMSKSYGNTIFVTEDRDSVREKAMVMVTDPARVRRTDPGDPEKCSVWSYHKIFTDASRHEEIQTGCRAAGIGCRDCKKILVEALEKRFDPIRERRATLEADAAGTRDLIEHGNARAREVARATMERVREKLNLNG